MQLRRLYTIRPKELQAIYDSLGGKYGYRERLARQGTGSPRLYYIDGHPEIDQLRDRASDELRLNFEEFKNGLLVGITERTEPYILPLKTSEIVSVEVILTPEIVQPRPGTFFGWLLRKGFPASFAQYFARSEEIEHSRTEISVATAEFSIHCWADAREYSAVRGFFEKSVVADRLKVG